tara:strand:- start:1155 stop:1916 length:762 start_codon:yes stop_codon:yes gene_type:complete
MNLLHAIILGVIQGITEWLPVSSSGHLVIAQNLFSLGSEVVFDLWLHIATLLVIFTVFRKDIISILRAVLTWDSKSKEFKWGLYVLLANIPILVVGFFLRNYISTLFASTTVVGVALLFTATILFVSEKRTIPHEVNFKNSIVTGIFQAMAIVPGISRSGTTISSGLLQGISKQDAAKFSFLMAIPAFIGAGILKAGEISAGMFSLPYLIGFLTALIVGYFSLKLLLRIIEQKKLHYFAYYCAILGVIVLILF